MSFSTLVVHPDLDARMRFKATATTLNCFRDLTLVSSLEEGKAKLESHKNVELIYLSSRYDQSVASQFIRSGKSGPSKAAGYVLMVNGNQIKSQAMASYLMEGIDGVLPEPFSPESLQKSTERVSSVIHGRKRKLAIEMYVQQAAEAVDKLAELHRKGLVAPNATKTLEDLHRVLSDVDEEEFSYYVSNLITVFESAKPFVPEQIIAAQKEYQGPSDRVRRMILKKIR